MLVGITAMVSLMLGLMLTIQCTLSAVFVKLNDIQKEVTGASTASTTQHQRQRR